MSNPTTVIMTENRFKTIAKNLKAELEKSAGIDSIGHAKMMQALSHAVYGMPFEALKVKLNSAETYDYTVFWHPIDRDRETLKVTSTSRDEDVILDLAEKAITQQLFEDGEITHNYPETEAYVDYIMLDGDLFSEGMNFETTLETLEAAVGKVVFEDKSQFAEPA